MGITIKNEKSFLVKKPKFSKFKYKEERKKIFGKYFTVILV